MRGVGGRCGVLKVECGVHGEPEELAAIIRAERPLLVLLDLVLPASAACVTQIVAEVLPH